MSGVGGNSRQFGALMAKIRRSQRRAMTSGRTVKGILAVATDNEIDALRDAAGLPPERHGHVWTQLSGVQRLDEIATFMLAKDRSSRMAEGRRAVESEMDEKGVGRNSRRRVTARSDSYRSVMTEYPHLSVTQMRDRSLREMTFHDMDVLADRLRSVDRLRLVVQRQWGGGLTIDTYDAMGYRYHSNRFVPVRPRPEGETDD